MKTLASQVKRLEKGKKMFSKRIKIRSIIIYDGKTVTEIN